MVYYGAALQSICLRTGHQVLKDFLSVFVRDLEEQRVRLWDNSQPMEEIDLFFSHTWQTAGRWKYLVLLLETGNHCFLMAWVMAGLLMLVLCLMGTIPLPFEATTRVLDFED